MLNLETASVHQLKAHQPHPMVAMTVDYLDNFAHPPAQESQDQNSGFDLHPCPLFQDYLASPHIFTKVRHFLKKVAKIDYSHTLSGAGRA